MNNDLISRQALINDMRSRSYIDGALCEIFETVVDEAPTAYDVDKVVNKLEKMKYETRLGQEHLGDDGIKSTSGYIAGLRDSIEIIRSGGIGKGGGEHE